jgi:putative ABC transport system permease protein
MIGTLLAEAWLSIGVNRLRTFLTMLGIIIGVGSVVLLVSIGMGSQKVIRESINKLGSNLLIISPGNYSDGYSFDSKRRDELRYDDVIRMADLPSVAAVAAVTND